MNASSEGVGSLGQMLAPGTVESVTRLLRSLPGRGNDVRAVLNGLFGDALAEQESSLAIPLTFRTASGEELRFDRDGLARALPNAARGSVCSCTDW